MFPKVVALDTDWTIFWGDLDANRWGKGPGAFSPIEDNIMKSDFWEVYDQSNSGNKCGMLPDVPEIIGDILKNGAKLAIVSRNKSKAMCDRALWHWQAKDASGNYQSIISLASYDEIYDRDKVEHFNKIHSYDTNVPYSDMILFDDDPTSNTVEMMIGVTFQVCRGQKGLTWDNYREGIETWRRNKSIITPFVGLDLSLYPKRKFLGYSGMDIETIKLLEKGWRRHDRKEAARFGFAVYIADDPAIAKYFKEWIKYAFGGNQAETIVCKLYARDGDVWDRLNKIWVPESAPQTNVNGPPLTVAWSQEDRDRLVASWGAQKPYVLFSRHVNMGGNFPVAGGRRWNEMVVYGQIQEAQLLTIRLTDAELNNDIGSANHVHYERKIQEWGIKVPQATQIDWKTHGESGLFA